MKKILLVLDNSKPGLRAQQYAIDLAKSLKVSLTGLAILDTPWITAAQPEPLGVADFKLHRDDAVIKKSQEHINFLFTEFQGMCKKAQLDPNSIEAEGFPAVEIEKLAHEHDVIIMGKTTDFHFDLDDDSDLTVKHVARDNPRPLILVPETVPETKTVMVAFDGSLEASRSLHMFLLLGLARGRDIQIVSGHKIRDKAEVQAKRAINMCQAYGLKAHHYVHQISSGSPAEYVLEMTEQLKASMLVMGGFSHNLLHEAVFGSNTKTIMKSARIPVFIHH